MAISIHALLAESDAQATIRNTYRWQFLSTLSLRRATLLTVWQRSMRMHFYPRSPCGERRATAHTHRPRQGFLSTLSLRRATHGFPRLRNAVQISIHALLAESDDVGYRNAMRDAISIHALLAESDDISAESAAASVDISIHALLAESDCQRQIALIALVDFYPRSPCGERPSPRK